MLFVRGLVVEVENPCQRMISFFRKRAPARDETSKISPKPLRLETPQYYQPSIISLA